MVCVMSLLPQFCSAQALYCGAKVYLFGTENLFPSETWDFRALTVDNYPDNPKSPLILICCQLNQTVQLTFFIRFPNNG